MPGSVSRPPRTAPRPDWKGTAPPPRRPARPGAAPRRTGRISAPTRRTPPPSAGCSAGSAGPSARGQAAAGRACGSRAWGRNVSSCTGGRGPGERQEQPAGPELRARARNRAPTRVGRRVETIPASARERGIDSWRSGPEVGIRGGALVRAHWAAGTRNQSPATPGSAGTRPPARAEGRCRAQNGGHGLHERQERPAAVIGLLASCRGLRSARGLPLRGSEIEPAALDVVSGAHQV